MALVNRMIANSMGGIVFLRIEDTDQKREVKGATQRLIDGMANFGIKFDEKPYIQSQRVDIYKKHVQKLVEAGLAYHDDGAIRFKAPQTEERITWADGAKGSMSLPPLERDPVIMKSNGIPPYNLAHVVDDFLMGTTHVVRGEEWLPSTAEHIQLYQAIEVVKAFEERTRDNKNSPPWQYIHMPVICIEENGKKRKLSKRKDKHALAQTFLDEGYPPLAIIEYLLTLYNTDFEMWRIENPCYKTSPFTKFNFRFEKVGTNSPLFDLDKLNHISRNIIAKMTKDEIKAELEKFFADNKEVKPHLLKIKNVLSIDRETEKPRKDIAKFSEIPTEYDFLFHPAPKNPVGGYSSNLTKEEWLHLLKIHKINMKELRKTLTGRESGPDLYQLMKIIYS